MNILKFIISVIVVYFLYQIAKKIGALKSTANPNDPSRFPAGKGEELVEDPVCHTYIPVSQAYKREISGKDYYFCSKKCSDQYPLEKNN